MILWAIILCTLVLVLIVAISTSSRQSADRGVLRSAQAANFAVANSAVSKLGFALQSRLIDERTAYAFDDGKFEKLLTDASAFAAAPSNDAGIASKGEIHPSYQEVAGVYEPTDVGGSVVLNRICGEACLPPLAHHEPVTLSRPACLALGLSEEACRLGSGRIRAWWQVYRIDLPDRVSDPTVTNGKTTFYIRTWFGPPPPSAGTPPAIASKASVVRADMRPGQFADYLFLSDSSIRFTDGAVINGPVHSNGFETEDPANRGLNPTWGIKLDGSVTCTARGSLSTARKTIQGLAGSNCQSNEGTQRFISFLRVGDEIKRIAADDATYPDVHVYGPVTDPDRPALEHAYRIWFQGASIRVDVPVVGGGYNSSVLSGAQVDSGLGAILFRDDVIVMGGDLNQRFTIAASRDGAGAASIYIANDVNRSVTANEHTLGLIAQGDIVVLQNHDPASPNPCQVTFIRAAMIAATGGFTINPEYTTQQYQPNAPRCTGRLQIHGTIAGHRAPLTFWQWDDGGWTGYDDREYAFDPRMNASSPPYFPLTGTWQALNIREANVDCYAATGMRADDPTCR